jgi:AcrR family transcriptional regulator
VEGHACVTAEIGNASSASAQRLVVAAERLFAERGIDGVSLRQIAAEAGSGNNSAVHYHFGSKHGLIRAIFHHRLRQIISERQLLASRGDPGDLRSRCEAEFLPVLNLAEATDNRYVSFVEQLQRNESSAPDSYFPDLPDEGRRSSEQFRRDLDRMLPQLDEPLRQIRILEAQALFLHAAADRERAVAAGITSVPFDLFVHALLDGITGFLAARPSAATLRRLDHAEAMTIRRPSLL